MTTIQAVLATEIFDSEGIPTIEVTLVLSDNTIASSSISFSERDSNIENPYKKTQNAIKAISDDLQEHLLDQNISDQNTIDNIISEASTQNSDLSNVGIAVSQAALKAGAQDKHMPVWMYLSSLINEDASMPRPIFPVIQGRAYVKKLLDFKEYMIIPAERTSFGESLDIGMKIYHSLIKEVAKEGKSIVTSQSGGIVPDVKSNKDVLNVIKAAVESSHLSFTHDVFLGINADANNIASESSYTLNEEETSIGKGKLIEHYINLYKDFSLIYLEEPFIEGDNDSYKKLISLLSSKTLILKRNTSQDVQSFEKKVSKSNINGVSFTMTYPQTISQYITLSKYAKAKKISVSLTQNDAITQDNIRADIAVGLGCDYANFGVPASERIILYNRLLSIQQEMHHMLR